MNPVFKILMRTLNHRPDKRGEVESKAFDLPQCVFVRQLLNFDMCRLKTRTEYAL